MCAFRKLGRFLRTKDDLCEAFAIAQIDKDDATEVPPGMNPAGELDLLANVGGAKGIAVVRAIHEIVIALLFVAAVIAAAFFYLRKGTPPPGASADVPEKSIAVLPFNNLSEEKANAFFTEGVQDQILTALAKLADLKVISRTSVMNYKSDAPRNLREIGQQLGVAHLLEGSVQRAGNKVRVNAQLINARTDAHGVGRSLPGRK